MGLGSGALDLGFKARLRVAAHDACAHAWYYEVLERSSARWHDGKHDAWPAMNFLIFILTQACKEFEQRVGQVKSPRGEKTAMVLAAIDRQAGAFSVSDLQNECPGVGVDLVRKVLKQLRGSKVVCLGRGQTAKWKKSGK